MQEQLTELQLKLAKEEEEKGNVSKLNQDLKTVTFKDKIFVLSELFSSPIAKLYDLSLMSQFQPIPGTKH